MDLCINQRIICKALSIATQLLEETLSEIFTKEEIEKLNDVYDTEMTKLVMLEKSLEEK